MARMNTGKDNTHDIPEYPISLGLAGTRLMTKQWLISEVGTAPCGAPTMEIICDLDGIKFYKDYSFARSSQGKHD
jgi:hypothetical protein